MGGVESVLSPPTWSAVGLCSSLKSFAVVLPNRCAEDSAPSLSGAESLVFIQILAGICITGRATLFNVVDVAKKSRGAANSPGG